MEESPPPVPPKDAGYRSGMESSSSRPPTAPASGSKRKRGTQDYDFRSGRLDSADLDGHTPKRSRSRSQTGVRDNDASNDDTPYQRRSVQRKRGIRNLSTLNLRHAASAQALMQRQTSPTRESRFQEGSLTDKPSEKPPSLFTRLPHTDSGNLSYEEELMSDYHEGMPAPAESVEARLQYEMDTRDDRVAEISARQRTEEQSGIFRFGKSLASSFHPLSLWNRLWNEQKEELTRRNVLESESKTKLKADAEEKYAEMKRTGQLGLQHVTLATPRDSGIAFDAAFSANPHARTTSSGSVVRESQEDDNQRENSEVPESSTKPASRGLKSRLHLRKPSLQNLQNTLKRVRSDFNIGAAASRESLSSVSPFKMDLDNPTLPRSHSKYDLKKQHKLSKRVSDLESKLNKARVELDEALVQASPMPKLGSKYGRFTPSGTLRKPKFVPGALPTLPSEGVLFPKELGFAGDGGNVTREPRSRPVIDLNTAFDDIDEDEDEETIRITREEKYPTRAKDLFNQFDEKLRAQTGQPDETTVDNSLKPTEPTSELTEFTETNPHSFANVTSDGAPSASKGVTDADVDASEDAFESNKKTAHHQSRSKKRSSRNQDELAYKPGVDDDDDAEWNEAIRQSSKKRKSTSKVEVSPSSTRSGDKKPKSSATQFAKKGTSAASPAKNKKSEQAVGSAASGSNMDEMPTIDDTSEDELAKTTSARASITSEDLTLEPVYEEDEETTKVPLKDAPSKPTAKATPARFGYNGVRSHPNSPQKRALDTMANGHNQSTDDVVVSVVPGEGEVPPLPNGAVKTTKEKKRLTATENFKWPDDIF